MNKNKFQTVIEKLEEAKNNFDAFASKYSEDLFFDFKRGHPLTTKHNNPELSIDEFLADVASFANTSGGCLIYGIDEDKGLPTKFYAFEEIDTEKLKQKLAQSIRERTEPRISGCEFHFMKIETGEYVLAVFIPKSWNSPHGVRKSGGDHLQFFGRGSDGNKFPYRFNQLKDAILSREGISNQMRTFRDHRINKINVGETPLPLINEGAKIVLHFLPMSAFENKQNYNIEQFYDNRRWLSLLSENNWQTDSKRRNFDGILYHDNAYDNGKHLGYIQLYRTGIIEITDTHILANNHPEKKNCIPGEYYEKVIVNSVTNYLKALSQLEVEIPIFLAISILDIKGYTMIMDMRRYLYGPQHPVDKEILVLPEIEITDLTQEAENLLKPSFDLIWNACGMKQSLNYDEANNWIHAKSQSN